MAPRAQQSWTGQPVGVRFLHREAGVRHQLGDVANEVASAGDALLDAVEATLPRGNAGVRGQTVLEEEQLAARTKHASDLAQCTSGVGHSTQRERADRGVAAVVGQGKRLSVESHETDRNR